jgi:hypothetical protein
MEATVKRVLEFLLTGEAHGKDVHRRLVTIVRHVLNNGETWAAVGTVDEWIPIAPIGRSKEFMQTIVARSSVRRDQGSTFWSGLAVENDKGSLMPQRDGLDGERNNACQSWCLCMQCTSKACKSLYSALNFDDDPQAVVEYEPCQSPARGLIIDKGAETYSLNDPLHNDT